MSRQSIITICLLASLVFSACTQSLPQPGTPDLTTNPSSIPVRTNTPLPSETPTLTPTATSTPTRTPTPLPTATPQGFFDSGEGFSFIHPANWELAQESPGQKVFIGEDDQLVLIVIYDIVGEAENVFTDFLDGMVQELGTGFTDFQVGEPEEITVGNELSAQHVLMNGNNEEGVIVGFEVLFIQSGAKVYILTTVAEIGLLEARRSTLQRIYNSIELNENILYGVDRDQALVLLGYTPDADELDPALARGSVEDYPGLLFSGLVRLSPSMQIEPDLAESFEVRGDGLVYTFTLRPDLTFQSGESLTTEDVVYSWERALDPSLGSTTARTYLGDIQGAQAKLDRQAQNLTGLSVVDERTLVVTLEEPRPYFLAKLTYPTAFIVNESNVETNPLNWALTPDASGPFALKELQKGDGLVFERNLSYHTPAELTNIVYLLDRAGTPLSYYEAGEVDIIGVAGEDAKQILEPDDPLHDQLKSFTSMCTTYIQMNNTRPPLDNILVRQALVQAIDKDHLVELLTENLALRADTILPPAMPGYTAELGESRFDPEAAQMALEEAQSGDPLPPISIAVSGYGDSDNPFINALVDIWREYLDLEVEVVYLNPEDFTTSARQQESQMVTFGWCADYPDPANFLEILFLTGSDFNLTGYSNPQVDALLQQAGTELDPATRLALYQQVERMLQEDYATLPLMHSVAYTLVNPRVSGYTASPLSVLQFHRLSVSPAGR